MALSIVTLGIFPWIWFGLMHGKLPKNRPDDPSALRAILFQLIPFFNFYWMFFVNLRMRGRPTGAEAALWKAFHTEAPEGEPSRLSNY